MRLNSPWKQILALLQVTKKENKTVKGPAPAAKHVEQPWNVYSQAYMKAARDSIATQIRTGQAFWAFASLVR